jgi:uncharacterized protein (TIGR03437 family)
VLLAGHTFGRNLTLQVSNETAPAGGWAQIKVFASTPVQIANGLVVLNLDPAVFGAIENVVTFSAEGDAEGTMFVQGQSLIATIQSASNGIGQLPGLPILTITVPLLASVQPGTTSAITLDPLTGFRDANQNLDTFSLVPGSVTVGGALSVESISPGGGLLAAGTSVRVLGRGFEPATTVSIPGASVSNSQFVSSTEIDVTFGGACELTGRKVTLTNPGGEAVQFYSATPSAPSQAPAGLSAMQVVPSLQTWTSASISLPSAGGGVALQNPNAVPVDVILQSRSSHAPIAAQTNLTIAPGALNVYYTGNFGRGTPGNVAGGDGFNVVATLPLRIIGISLLAGALGSPTPRAVTAAELPLQKVIPSPSAVTFNWQIGTTVPAPATIALATPAGNFSYTVSSPGAPFAITASVGALTVVVDPSGLSPGTYPGSITISPEGPNPSVTTIPLSLIVSAAGLLSTSSSSLTFFDSSGFQGDLSITTNGSSIPFTATAINGPGLNWLSVSPVSGMAPAQLFVKTDATGLSVGEYQGQILVSGPNNMDTVSVQLMVRSPDSFYGLSPSTLSFTAPTGAASPPPQTVTMSVPRLATTFSVSTASGGSWLMVSESPLNGFFGAVVTVNPAGLKAGTYQGIVTVTSTTEPGPASFPVTLTIWDTPPVLAVTPPNLTFTAPVFTAAEAQTIQVTSGGVPLSFETSRSGSAVLTTPAALSIPGYASQLGDSTQSITFTAGSQTVVVPVTIVGTVSSSLPPFLGSIVNAASQLPGSVSPGEILTVFGYGAGPPAPTSFTLDASGNVATSLNGAQVLFDGTPAPMIYGSAYVANVIVPYEVANQSTTTITLQYGGVTSAGWAVPVTGSAPGIFTLGQAGLGQGAVLNQDNSVNGPSNPALRGSVIQIFSTGEGQTAPPGVTASVIGTNLKQPVLPVRVNIGGKEAVVNYDGSAGDAISGEFQVNAVVPQDVAPGTAVPIIVYVGGVPSQTGATIVVE